MNKKLLTTLSAVVCCGLLLTGCGSGSASPTVTVTEEATYVPEPMLTDDEKFISTIRNYGNTSLDTLSDQDLISLGISTCDLLDSGYTAVDIITYVATEFPNMTSDQAEGFGFVMGAAVAVYCPEYTSDIQALG